MTFKLCAFFLLLTFGQNSLATISLTVKQFLANKRAQDSVIFVNGKVKSHNPCPTCPPKALCKPCAPEILVLEDPQDSKSTLSIRIHTPFIKGSMPRPGDSYGLPVQVKKEGDNTFYINVDPRKAGLR